MKFENGQDQSVTLTWRPIAIHYFPLIRSSYANSVHPYPTAQEQRNPIILLRFDAFVFLEFWCHLADIYTKSEL